MIHFPPFRYEDAEIAWRWLNEFPSANFDDFGPQSVDELRAEMRRRIEAGEKIYGVVEGGDLCGLIGYVPGRVGMFHGICFAKRVHRSGLAEEAVREFI